MLSGILENEQDLPFAAALVQALNLILLTAPEVGATDFAELMSILRMPAITPLCVD